MAAPTFMISDDDIVADSHLLTQSLLARLFWSEPRLFVWFSPLSRGVGNCREPYASP
ncbi:hypothetical protein LINGRAHAP2_LOCUS1799 [Linum grandiflorum]